MGLGKTVQAIALMAINPPDLDDVEQQEDRRTATLIIAPAALLDQVSQTSQPAHIDEWLIDAGIQSLASLPSLP